MADIKQWPYALNQPGYDYPAELFRAQHYDATSGGNGVGSPTALKVSAQPAPDGTVRISPGGATIRSTYPGAEGQSYHAQNFQPYTLTVPPRGSGGERHDLVILRVCDPQYDVHPDHPGGEISEEEAADYDFWWFELHQGRAANTTFDFPFVPLAHIRRPANTTIVTDDHIVDLRQMANPKTWLHMRANQLLDAETEYVYSETDVWPEDATQYVRFPEWATRLHVSATWGTIRSHHEHGDSGNPANGSVQVRFNHPDGDRYHTQASLWNFSGDQDSERISVVLGDNRPIPAKYRGELVRVEMLGNKRGGPNVYMDGASSWVLQLYFEQEIA